ncbi:hypothetical protein ACWGJP_05860 [Microbacterium sp. NPDC055903]
MNTTDASLDERIRAFAAAVRAQLDDLPAEDADDITAGLAADLADAAADDPAAIDLDDPTGYAAELRAAAGLPPRGERPARLPVSTRVKQRLASLNATMRESRFGAWLLDLLLALRPVWWVLRGLSVYGIIQAITGSLAAGFWPSSPLGVLLLGAIVLVSIQWGRDRWLPKNALRHARTVVSVIAVIALPFTTVWMVSQQVQYVSDEYYAPDGLLLDGVQVGNIFAYDADGELIPDVQLYTGKGTPLNLNGASSGDFDYGWLDDSESITVPLRDARGQAIWNVYPLQQATLGDDGEIDESTLAPAPAPFVRAPGLREASDAEEQPTPSPTPTPTVEPTP